MNEDKHRIQIWLDEEGDSLTVTWGFEKGYYSDTNDDRVMVRLDMEGNVQGVQIGSLDSIRNKLIEARHSAEWWDQLGKDNRGSRPRCVLLMDGSAVEVAQRLTRLVAVPDVEVGPQDYWMPLGKPLKVQDAKWDRSPANETELHKSDSLLDDNLRAQLRDWWLAEPRSARTPSWDIASTCLIKGEPGLLLMEAKSHLAELAPKRDKCASGNQKNRDQIAQAMAEANRGLHIATEGQWNLSRDHHYQMSNRFAWAWKLASLGIPVVLVYLGFLNARDMSGRDLFISPTEWENCLMSYGRKIVDNSCWDQWWDIAGTPMLPLIRSFDQPFFP